MQPLITENNFVITYDKQKYIVIPNCWSELETIYHLQKEILKLVIEQGGYLGDLFRPSNQIMWNLIKDLTSNLNVVGGKKIDPEKISNIEELCKIYITSTVRRNEKYGMLEEGDQPFLPSEICRINGINFFELLKIAGKEVRIPQN